ncbi:MAG: hypothetical protein VYE17_11890 [Pseudomonadota bacterium]|nr:hypothetical protein [Pseudomonadota bacterium]MEE2871226.1 hypothetical protein [Pseudomonadota bacterium]
MSIPELSNTLLALIEAFEPPVGVELQLTGAEVQAPLQLSLQRHGQQLLLGGAPPATVMHTGFEPVVHKARLIMETRATQTAVEPGVGDHDG